MFVTAASPAALAALSALQKGLRSLRSSLSSTSYGGGQVAAGGASAWQALAEAYNAAQVGSRAHGAFAIFN